MWDCFLALTGRVGEPLHVPRECMDPSGFVIHGLSRKVHKQAHEQAQSIEKIVTTGILLQNKTSLPKRACTAIGIMS
mgnify:CR=1 FL=1